ncbi:hypothetical protein ES708_06659 [subsurface metagenome]
MGLFASIANQIRNVSKDMIRLEKSQTVKTVVKIIFFVLKLIFRNDCNGSNKKG